MCSNVEKIPFESDQDTVCVDVLSFYIKVCYVFVDARKKTLNSDVHVQNALCSITCQTRCLQITDLAVVPRHSCPRSAADYAIVANSGSKVNVHISGRPVSEMTSLYDVVLQNIPLMTCTDDECVLAVHDFNPGFSNNMYMVRGNC